MFVRYTDGRTTHNTITIIIVIRQQLGLDTLVSTLSNNLFKGLPSRLRPFGL